jgi:hypothetical protein
MPYRISRQAYAETYGPTTGDRIRLADTELILEVEKDYTVYGDEVKFGGGKVIRDGMGQAQTPRSEGAVDTVITNALILDWWGIVKADVGLRDGRIVAIGKAGNPDVQEGVTIVVGPGTEAIAGEGHILTAGWNRQPHPFHLPTADRNSLGEWGDNNARRWHRTRHWNQRDHLHPRCIPHRPHASSRRRIAGESGFLRQGQRQHPRGPGRAGEGRGLRPQTP